MKMLTPITVTDAMLTSSTVPETPPAAWLSGTTYGLGDQASTGTEGGVITVWESLQAGNTNNDPTSSPTWWKDMGDTYSAWSATRLYVDGEIVLRAGTHRVYEALVGAKSTVTITIATPGVATWTAHGLAADTPVVFTTTGALPTGLTAGTTYYVRSPATDTFQVSATTGGASINTSGTQSGVHTCGLASNYAQTPETSTTAWLDIGPTNKWAMFDQSVGSVSSSGDPIVVEVSPGTINALALLNLVAQSVRVEVVVDTVTIYDETYPMEDRRLTLGWWAYFFLQLRPQTSIVIEDLPPAGALTVTIDGTECGTLAFGRLFAIGGTLYSPKIGIIDYSKKETDAYGITDVVERNYAKRYEVDVWCDNRRVDGIVEALAAVRATPVVWIGDEQRFASLLAYGFYRDFDVVITYPTVSNCRLSIEGLT